MNIEESYIELQKLIDQVDYGEVQLGIKKHNHQIAEISVPYSKTIKADFTKAYAYIMEQMRDAQLEGRSGSMTFTITYKDGNLKQLAETGYINKKFRVVP